MQIDIITCFPEMFVGPFDFSIVKRAQDKGLVKINIHNLRKWSTDKYKSVDDRPYGGGAGMIMRVDLIDNAIKSIRAGDPPASLDAKHLRAGLESKSKVILLDARGEKFTQRLARDLAHDEHLILICGHYEGVDHRVHEHIADEVISIGDYVLSGGEIPAMVIVDTVTRLLPGALGNEKSLEEESFTEHRIPNTEYPQYTRPEKYNGWKVPEVLLSGDHKKIKKWRLDESEKNLN